MLVAAGGIGWGIVTAACVIAAAGSKLGSGEGDAAEHFAGVLRIAAGAVAAFLGGNGVIQHRHNQLGIPLKPDDGKLTQGYEQPTLISGKHQFFVEQLPDIGRNLHHAAAAAVAGVLYLAAQHHGIQYLHH